MKHNYPSLRGLLRLSKEGQTFYTEYKDSQVSSAAHYLGMKVTTKRLQVIEDNKVSMLTQVLVHTPAVPSPKVGLEEIQAAIEWGICNLGKHTRPSPLDKLLTRLTP